VEQPSREQITEALGKVIDPELKRPVTELDMVREVRVENGHVAVTIALTVAGCPLRSSFETRSPSTCSRSRAWNPSRSSST